MNDGAVVFDTRLNNKQLEKDYARTVKKIEDIENEINVKGAKRSGLVKQAYALVGKLDAAKARLHEMQMAGRGVFSADQLSMQKEQVAHLQSEWDGIQNRIDAYDRQLSSCNDKLEIQKNKAGRLTEKLEEATNAQSRFDGAADAAVVRIERLTDRIGKLATRALVFSVITHGFRLMRDWLGEVVTKNDQASEAIARLKGALLTMAQPLIDVVIPAFTVIVNLLTAVIGKVAAFLSMLGGKTVKESTEAAKALNKQADAYGSAGDAAEDARKQLMGFDEINKLEDNSTSSGGGGGSGEIAPDFSWSDGITETLDRIADLVLLIAAGLALWKISQYIPGQLGTILGNLGLILAALGGVLIFLDGFRDAWENGVDWGNIAEMVLGLAVAAGALYAAFGPVAAGITLIAGGLAMLVTGFRDAMESGFNLENTLLSIAGIIATGLGITLLAGSLIPLLIAAIASLLLAFTVATGHGEELIAGLKTACQGFVEFFSGIFSGDLEKATGGIEKIFSGLGTFVLAVVDGLKDSILSFLDWLDEKTGGKFHSIIEFIKQIVMDGFGVLKTFVSDFFESLKQTFLGLTQFLSGVFSGNWDLAFEGLRNIAAGGLNGIIAAINGVMRGLATGINAVVDLLNAISFTIPNWVPVLGGSRFCLNLPRIVSVPQIPYLAEGAVIPPNREFMAVLGDQTHGNNIEAPEDLIRQIVREESGKDSRVAELLEILIATVEGIEVGDEVIGRAAARYNRRASRAGGY